LILEEPTFVAFTPSSGHHVLLFDQDDGEIFERLPIVGFAIFKQTRPDGSSFNTAAPVSAVDFDMHMKDEALGEDIAIENSNGSVAYGKELFTTVETFKTYLSRR